MSQARTLSVGLDVHTESLAVASVAQAQGAAVVSRGTVGTRPGARDQRLRPRRSKRPPRVCVDAAGPCGSWLERSRMQPGDVCGVVAPSLKPTKAGDRGTTDRRDALPLARRMRAGALTPVSVTAVDEAAIRALRLAREETRRDLQAATWRLNAFVRRYALRAPGRTTWSPAPRRWLSAVIGPTPAPHLVLQAYVQTVTARTERLGRLAHARHAPGHTWRVAPVVEALQPW